MENINDDFIEKLDKEDAERTARMIAIEEKGKERILYYFDRIHSNLFNYNNLLIAGYFALTQLDVSISKWSILVPIVNLWILVFIDYRLMEKSRFESNITNQPLDEIDKYGKAIQFTTLFSFLCIISTLITTIIFIVYLLN